MSKAKIKRFFIFVENRLGRVKRNRGFRLNLPRRCLFLYSLFICLLLFSHSTWAIPKIGQGNCLVFHEANFSSKTIGSILKGELVNIIDSAYSPEKAKFYVVKTPTGEIGYVSNICLVGLPEAMKTLDDTESDEYLRKMNWDSLTKSEKVKLSLFGTEGTRLIETHPFLTLLAVVLLILWFIVLIGWVLLPFAVFGIKKRLDRILEVLCEIKKITSEKKDV